jgi:hypothetical protein
LLLGSQPAKKFDHDDVRMSRDMHEVDFALRLRAAAQWRARQIERCTSFAANISA